MNQSETAMQKFDVVIVGGGMVGASLSLLLNSYMQQGLSVALLDAQSISPQTISNLQMQQPSFDERTTAISLGSKRILNDLGVWSYMEKAATAIEHIQVSRQKQFGRVRLHADDANVEALGYVVENKHIGVGLQSGLLQQKDLTIFAPVTVKKYHVVDGGAHIELINESNQCVVLVCDLLVLADGANSEGCKQLGISQTRYDYQQHALVCNVSLDRSHDQWAYERFTSDGPMALLPISGNRYALVWCMSTENAERRIGLSEQAFKAELQTNIGFDKGRILKVGQASAYPLALVQASEQVRQHVVVLGNAAHALHPVAGQGFNLALRDAKALAQIIGQQLSTAGNVNGLKHYLENQKLDQAITTHISHLFPEKFSEPGLHWSIARSLAMTLMDLSPTAKRLFANQAMGLVGKVSAWRP